MWRRAGWLFACLALGSFCLTRWPSAPPRPMTRAVEPPVDLTTPPMSTATAAAKLRSTSVAVLSVGRWHELQGPVEKLTGLNALGRCNVATQRHLFTVYIRIYI